MENDDKFRPICSKVSDSVGDGSSLKFSQVDNQVVEKALSMLKSNKSDSVFDVTSDFYLNSPPELIPHLTNLIRLFLAHGYVPQIVLLCTLLPLVKDGFGDITKSDNYRAIVWC